MTSNALFLDVVAIPENMAVYASATKTIAFGMLPILFTVTAIEEQAKVIRNEQNDFPRLFYSTVAAFFTLVFFYSWFFTKIVALCEAIGLTMYSAYDWAAFQSMISDPAQELSKTGLWKMGLVAVLSGGIVFLSGIIEFVFELVRYSLLCLLYVLGPIAIVMGIYPKTTSMFKGWVINVAQISAWIIMLRILQGVLLAIGIDALNNPTFFKGAATGIVSLVYVYSDCACACSGRKNTLRRKHRRSGERGNRLSGRGGRFRRGGSSCRSGRRH